MASDSEVGMWGMQPVKLMECVRSIESQGANCSLFASAASTPVLASVLLRTSTDADLMGILGLGEHPA